MTTREIKHISEFGVRTDENDRTVQQALSQPNEPVTQIEAFEKWHDETYGVKPSFNRDHEGSSHWDGTKQDRWEGWQAALSQPSEQVMSEFDKFHKEAFETRIKQLEINNVKLVEALTLSDKVLSLIMIDEAYHEERANIDTIYTMRNDSFKLTKAAIPKINLELTGE